MKKLQKIGAFITAAFMCVAMTACGGESLFGEKNKDTLRVLIYEAGSGTEWLNKMAEEYKKETGITVKVSVSYLGGEIESMIESETTNSDIVMPQARLAKYANAGKLVELSDVYDAVPEGESKSIKEKMNQSVYKGNVGADGKIYMMNWIDALCSLCYNKSTLDKLFPAGYTLPRTTDELFEFAESIKTESKSNVYPFSFSTAGSVGYMRYAHMVWWAQYEGLTAYSDFYKGYYWEDGQRKLAANGEIFDMPGREKSLQVASDLWRKDAGYSHAQSGSMTFTEAQIAFVGQGYKGQDNREVAMMLNGDWLENEMSIYLANKPQEIRMMRLPMISDITERLSQPMDDKMLRNVITAIDNGASSYANVPQPDFNRIKEARLMVFSQTIDHPIAIPATSTKQQQAKNFLIFLASDKGQAVYAKQLNGLTQAYGYTPNTDDVSAFAESRRQTFGDDYICIDSNHHAPLIWQGGLEPYANTTGIDSLLYLGDTPQSILTTTKKNFMSNWDNIIAWAE